MWEDTWESLGIKEIKPVNPKVNQSWIFVGRTYAVVETPIFWPPDVLKNWLIRKDPNARKDWRQKENGPTEDEMVGWHHRLNGHELEQAPRAGDREAQCVAVHGVTKSQTQLSDWTELIHISRHHTFLYPLPTWFQETNNIFSVST